jgi:CHAT domain-containing protein
MWPKILYTNLFMRRVPCSAFVQRSSSLYLKGAYLAFLGACETAKGDREQSDQAIHLAATMLFVGFKSVVATMW